MTATAIPSATDVMARRAAYLAAHPRCDVVRWVVSGQHSVMARCQNEARLEQTGPGFRRLVCGQCEGSPLHAVSGVTTRAIGEDR
jgi:hypothetical protein